MSKPDNLKAVIVRALEAEPTLADEIITALAERHQVPHESMAHGLRLMAELDKLTSAQARGAE